MTETAPAAGPRLYDLPTNSFISERNQIIDRVVRLAACVMTFSEAPPAGARGSDPADDLLRRAARERWVAERVRTVVRWYWRSEVMA